MKKKELREQIIKELIQDLPALDVKLPKDPIMLQYLIRRLDSDLIFYDQPKPKRK